MAYRAMARQLCDKCHITLFGRARSSGPALGWNAKGVTAQDLLANGNLMERPIMARIEPRDPLLAPAEPGSGNSSETAVIWPDPSPLDAWWRRIMHPDPLRRDAA